MTRDLLSMLLLIVGSASLLIGVVGIWRMPDLFTRLHAASVVDTLAVILILAGLALQSDSVMVVVKLALILFFLLFTTPVAAHALAKSALHGKLKPWLPDRSSPSR